MRLLLLEDDARLRQAYGRRLRADGHAVDEATSLGQARIALAETDYDCAVLDRLLPDGDAIQLVEELSAEEGRPSLLVLSGLGTGENRVDGLASGADDYLTKPADLEELVVRVRKLIVRRTPGPARLQLGRASVDRTRREVSIDGELVHLTPTQYAVFEQLVINLDRVVDQGTILDHCWDAQRDLFSNPLHADPSGSADDGVLGGGDADAPVSVCGVTVAVSAGAATDCGTSTGTGADPSGSADDGVPGGADVDAPISVCGVGVVVDSGASTDCGTTTATGPTAPSDGPGAADVDAPVSVCGVTAGVLGQATTSCGTSTGTGGAGGGPSTVGAEVPNGSDGPARSDGPDPPGGRR